MAGQSGGAAHSPPAHCPASAAAAAATVLATASSVMHTAASMSEGTMPAAARTGQRPDEQQALVSWIVIRMWRGGVACIGGGRTDSNSLTLMGAPRSCPNVARPWTMGARGSLWRGRNRWMCRVKRHTWPEAERIYLHRDLRHQIAMRARFIDHQSYAQQQHLASPHYSYREGCVSQYVTRPSQLISPIMRSLSRWCSDLHLSPQHFPARLSVLKTKVKVKVTTPPRA